MSQEVQTIQSAYNIRFEAKKVYAEITPATDDVAYSASGNLTIDHNDSKIFEIAMYDFPVDVDVEDDVDQAVLRDAAVENAIEYVELELYDREKSYNKNRKLYRRIEGICFGSSVLGVSAAIAVPVAIEDLHNTRGILVGALIGAVGLSHGFLSHVMSKISDNTRESEGYMSQHFLAVRTILEQAKVQTVAASDVNED